MHDSAVTLLVWFSAVILFEVVFYAGYYSGKYDYTWIGAIMGVVGVIFTLWKMSQ